MYSTVYIKLIAEAYVIDMLHSAIAKVEKFTGSENPTLDFRLVLFH
jgi:hypothetical protein